MCGDALYMDLTGKTLEEIYPDYSLVRLNVWVM